MADFEFCTLGAAKLDATTKLPTIQAVNPISDDSEDVESFGEVDAFGQLGVTALPYPADDNGHAEGLVARNVPGANGVLIGARDERTADITGNMKPGDTVLHSTGPEKAAQVQCKEELRQVVMATKTDDGKDAFCSIDGKQGTFTVQIGDSMLQITEDGDFTFANGKATLSVKGNLIALLGQYALGGDGGKPPIVLVTGGSGAPAVGEPALGGTVS